jgi:hypothetical protein
MRHKLNYNQFPPTIQKTRIQIAYFCLGWWSRLTEVISGRFVLLLAAKVMKSYLKKSWCIASDNKYWTPDLAGDDGN